MQLEGVQDLHDLLALSAQCPYIFSEMPAHVRNHSGRRAVIAAAAILLVIGLYLCAGISGYVRFGRGTQVQLCRRDVFPVRFLPIASA